MGDTKQDAADPVLDRLQEEYRHAWRIRRTKRLWIATALVEGVEPTIIEDTAAALEQRMRNPDRSVGGPLAPEPR